MSRLRIRSSGADPRLFGILNVHKPAGVTSRDVVNEIQRLVRPDKVGHAGTLDPLATGVLLVGVGQGARLVEAIHLLRKSYSAEFVLGCTSDSADVDEPVTELPHLPAPSREALEAALPSLLGRIQQVPPVYSAIKQSGKRAHQRARRGENFTLNARPVDVFELQVRRYEFPRLELDVICGTGCFVRSLGRDLARAVGSDAVMSRLVRTTIGPFRVEEACHPQELTRDNLASRLHAPLDVLYGRPRRTCDAADQLRLVQGRTIGPGDAPPASSVADSESSLAAAVNEQGELIATLIPDGRGGWRADRVFVSPHGKFGPGLPLES